MRFLLWALVALTSVAGAAEASEITFAERVRAQTAIERARYAHQIDAWRPFEETVPQALIEKKVRAALERSLALGQVWDDPITAEDLRAEAQRMARQTLMPGRLRELHAALGNRPDLILECLVRPVLAERLGREHFSSDTRIHAHARQEAESLREALRRGSLDPRAAHLSRSVTEIVIEGEEPSVGERVEVDRSRFEAWRGRLPARVLRPGLVEDEEDRFVVRVLLEDEPDRMIVATYAVPKVTWEEWWPAADRRMDIDSFTQAVGDDEPPVPSSSSQTDAAGSCGQWNNGILDDAIEPPSPRHFHTAVWTGNVVIVWGGYPASNTGGRYDPVADTWSPVSRQGAPVARAEHTAVWTGSEMLIWGGWNFGSPSSTAIRLGLGSRYDPIADVWTPMATNSEPTQRSEHTAVWTGSKMIVWGGLSDNGLYLGDGGSYDPSTDAWSPIQTSGAPTSRARHTVVWTGQRMIVWGGYTGPNQHATGGLYDPASDSWSPTPATGAPSARTGHTAVWTGEEMIIWGGGQGSQVDGVGGRYDPSRNRWTATSDLGGRAGHAAVWTGTRMLVWGGGFTGGPYSATGFSYNPKNDSAAPLATAGAPAGRGNHVAVWTGAVMFIHGGEGGGRSYARYSPAQNAWLPSVAPSEPRGRTGHTAIWTGNSMVVWGGYDEGQLLNSGFRYDPVLDTVTPTSMLNAPPPMSGHLSVWTGSEMIVWRSGMGGRYNPAADSWAPVATAGAPATAQSGQSAIWTGSEMIVWGGKYTYSCPSYPFTCTAYLNSGGRYDPGSDIWATLPTVGAPSRRAGHSALWTGSRMLIWGGECQFCNPQPQEGGLFDPATGTWTAMSTAGSPLFRIGHVAVWTGTQMIVWGGPDATGGVYSIASDQWTPTELTGAPAARGQTGVWTGADLLVWGGFQNGPRILPGPSDSLAPAGARYEPISGSWVPITQDGAPEARLGHTAVWTGASYLVWGGRGEESRLKSGGRFTPAPPTDLDGDGFDACFECDDASPAIYPGAPEICDGWSNDCQSTGWPGLTGTNEFDDDGDGHSECQGDCDDGAGTTWSTPGETSNMVFSSDGIVLTWDAPIDPGGTAVVYDVLRSTVADGFLAAQCVKSDGEGAYLSDSMTPSVGSVFYYLARADNACPGNGPLGAGSTGSPRPGRDCP